MVTLVVIINTLLSIILLYVAWRVWKIKEVFASIANKFTDWERGAYNGLNPTPDKIYSGQQSIYQLRQKNRSLKLQIEKAQQIMGLLLVGRQIWRRSLPLLGSKARKKHK